MGFEPQEDDRPTAAQRRAERRAARRARREAEEQTAVDAILQKIARSGLESLSAAEKRRLRQATRRKQQSQ
jgi:hypothetical protein